MPPRLSITAWAGNKEVLDKALERESEEKASARTIPLVTDFSPRSFIGREKNTLDERSLRNEKGA
jgi:hypothetical protein